MQSYNQRRDMMYCMCCPDKYQQEHISEQHAVMNILPLTTDVNKSTVSDDAVTTRTTNISNSEKNSTF